MSCLSFHLSPSRPRWFWWMESNADLSVDVDSSHRRSTCKTLRKYSASNCKELLKMLSNQTTRLSQSRPVLPEIDLQDTCKSASNYQGSLKMLSNRLHSTRIERLVSVDVDLSYQKSICKTLANLRVTTKGGWRCCRIDSIRLESNDSSQLMSTRHNGSRFAKHFENFPQVATKWGCRFCRIDLIRLEPNDLSQLMSTCHTILLV